MKQKGLFILFISMAVFWTIAQSNTNERSIETEINAVLQAQVDGWNNGDIDAYMKGYWQSDSLRFASGGSVNYGWQVTADRYKKRYNSRDLMGKLTFSEIDIKVISSDAALVFGKWELERKADHPWGLFTLLFRKTTDGWRIVHDHTSSADAE